MTYERITWVPETLRQAGLTVVEHDGWRNRGLGDYLPFTPRYLVWHHDASAPGDSPGVPDYMIRNFASAAAQLWVDRAGRWHIIAAGRAPHCGDTLPGMPTNTTSVGVETDHTSGESWPPALLASLRRGSAAILAVLGGGADALHFHKTICDPPGRKVDPAGLSLPDERRLVAALITPEDPMPTPQEYAQAVWDEIKTHDDWFRNQSRVATEAELLEQRPEIVAEIVRDVSASVVASLPEGGPVDAATLARLVAADLAARLQS